MSSPNQPRSLDDPSVRFRLVHEIRDDTGAPIGFGHLDTDAPVLLWDQPVDRINHAEYSELARSESQPTDACAAAIAGCDLFSRNTPRLWRTATKEPVRRLNRPPRRSA
jgi:hypothetical protein